MRAWQYHGFGDMRLDTIPYPELKPGWLMVKTRVVQLSITEIVRASGLATGGADYYARALAKGEPVRLGGHEYTAEVVEVGEGVEGFKPGDRIVPGAKTACGVCPLCKSGHSQFCRSGPNIAREIPGLLAEYAAVPVPPHAKIPENVSDSEGACIQSLTSAMAWIETSQLQIGDVVAVFGQGVMGLNCMQAARVSGAKKVIGIDVRPEALELSRKLGADEVVDATKVDPVEAILEFSESRGADVVFETAGGSKAQGLSGADTFKKAIAAVRNSGKVLTVGAIGDSPEVDFLALRKKDISVLSTHPPTKRTQLHAISLVATKRVQVAPTVTHVVHGLEKVPEAKEITANKAKYGAMGPAQIVVSGG